MMYSSCILEKVSLLLLIWEGFLILQLYVLILINKSLFFIAKEKKKVEKTAGCI